ncbi:MAG: TlpA family protein disulfide reductase [Verrucomicrobia bacterium]|nr:TlpA family protein disulfide reductase [Verrucomicrobiota bacterium]
MALLMRSSNLKTNIGQRFAVGLLCSMFVFAALGAVGAEKLIGTKASEWQVDHWLNSPPLKLANLRGMVVLVRWWTAPDCPYCAATAPALNEFYANYHQKGLEVVGLYHHKSSEPLNVEHVKKFSESFEFKFPVAIDSDWKTLHRWWLDRDEQAWTSVSFLIDRKGVIRHIHPGGQYVKGDKDYAAIKAKIEELLAER